MAWVSNPSGDRRTFEVEMTGDSNGTITLDIFANVAEDYYNAVGNVAASVDVGTRFAVCQSSAKTAVLGVYRLGSISN